MAEVKGFTFSESYYSLISDPDNGLSEDEKAQLYKAIIEYVFVGKIPNFKGVIKTVFSALLPSLEKSKTRSKAKQNKIKSKSNQNQNKIKSETKKQEKEEFLIKEKGTEKENYTLQEKEDIILSPPIIPQKIPQNGQGRFFEMFPTVLIDNYNLGMGDWTESDWEKIIDQFTRSPWLRQNVKTVSMLCRLSDRIIAGQYAPFEKVQTEQDEELSEDERRENAKWFEENFGKAGE